MWPPSDLLPRKLREVFVTFEKWVDKGIKKKNSASKNRTKLKKTFTYEQKLKKRLPDI